MAQLSTESSTTSTTAVSDTYYYKSNYTLYINPYNCQEQKVADHETINYYLNVARNSLSTEDSGVDLYIPENHTFTTNKIGSINHQVRCFMKETVSGITTGYYMYPRSSIYKYSLMLANSVGIIDAGYRGNLIAKVRCFENETNVSMGSKLFQICAPDLSPLNVKVILSPLEFMAEEASARGSNGFGSSGR